MIKKRRLINTYVYKLKPPPDHTRPKILNRTFIGKLNDLFHNLADDRESAELVQDMINNCTSYTRAVVEHESTRFTGKTIMDSDEYRKRLEELDRSRKITHNRLIDSVGIINRICSGRDMELIFTGDIDDRVEVGNFALKVVTNIFSSRKR